MVGSIGAGKETLTKYLREKGFTYYVTSDLLREELINRGIEITRSNLQDLGDEWREKFGPGVLMQKLLDKIDLGENAIIDSLRNTKEVEYLRENLDNFVLIAVDAPREIRYQRVVSRNKDYDHKTWDDFLRVDERDQNDLNNPFGQQVGACIKMADFVIINESDLESYQEKVEEIWKEIEGRVD